MIQRTVGFGASDQRVVKWALVAAVIALSMGYFAEHTLGARTGADGTTVAEKSVQACSNNAVYGAS